MIENILHIKISWYVSIAIIMVTMTAIWGWKASRLILFPDRDDLDVKPTEYGLTYEEVQFSSRDGIATSGFFIPAKKAKGTILVLHGYGTNKSDVLTFAEMFYDHGYSTLFFDFRAHGKTPGACTLGYLETRDLDGAVTYLSGRSDVDKSKIGVLGCSMGAVVAIIGAAKNPAIKAVVADSGFYSFEKTVTRFAKLFYGLPKYPFVPPAIWFAQVRAGFLAHEADPMKYIGRISPRPIFIIGGAQDVRIPPENQQQLFSAAGEPKQLWIVPEAHHLEARSLFPREYEKQVIEFFDKYIK